MAKFQKGQSGNPAGRPPGIPNPITRFRQQIAEHAPEIITAMVTAAKAGDTSAASLLLARLLPPVRPESPGQAIDDGGDMAARAESIVAATMNGTLSPTTASELMTVLAGQARIKELVELEERLAALEARTQ